jgi:5-methylcytosine-specific restriction endonuclease McrA
VLVVEVFDRAEIFERDNWTCYLCGEATDHAGGPFDPRYPTVDHVKPLSQGGEHSKANARTACFACNSARLNFDLPRMMA